MKVRRLLPDADWKQEDSLVRQNGFLEMASNERIISMNKSRLSNYSFVFSMLILLGILLCQAPNATGGNLIVGGEDVTGCPCIGTIADQHCSLAYSDCWSFITFCDVGGHGQSVCGVVPEPEGNVCAGELDSGCDMVADATCTAP